MFLSPELRGNLNDLILKIRFDFQCETGRHNEIVCASGNDLAAGFTGNKAVDDVVKGFSLAILILSSELVF